jgi:ribonuclease P protein component
VLPAGSRLRRREDFVVALRAGRRGSGRAPGSGEALLVTHLRIDRSGSLEPQVGFVVSKAVGNAVTRNRVRRRLRHAVATRLDALPEGSRTVVRVLPGAATAGYAALRAALDQALDRSLRAGQRTGSS